jgi:asparagine synthase (glutamine-hydrolysing)
MIARFGPDGCASYCKENLGIVYRAFHTTKESCHEAQPCVTKSGLVLTWTGRLDNREDLIAELQAGLPYNAPDVSIVAAAYERWKTACCAKLIGDWAFTAYDPANRTLILAKDFVGTRQLYYSIDKNHVTWSTVLDPLVALAGRSLTLDAEYIAGWLASLPAPWLTPYVEIPSVPPCCFVRISSGTTTVVKYWDFEGNIRIQYGTDREYEDHFRAVFFNAIRRRLHSNHPVVAELSGGMDSSSIVCVADKVIEGGNNETTRLDTVSYFDESDPNWNERPYFVRVEEKRNHTGRHIDVSARPVMPAFCPQHFAAIPSSAPPLDTASREFAAWMKLQGYRVLLSGIGGDEVMGGVPTPLPELQDLLVAGHFYALARRLTLWALTKRRPWVSLFWETVRDFLPPKLVRHPGPNDRVSWLCRGFVWKHHAVLAGYPQRLAAFGALPSFQQNMAALDGLRRQLACFALPSEPPHEIRYPYLDRNLLEFLYAIPREQVVRPGERRSLMRRALAGIVPGEVLKRRRKAFLARSHMAALSSEASTLIEMSHHMVSAQLGVVNPSAFRTAIQRVCHGEEIPLIAMLRTIEIEAWLRHLQEWVLLRMPPSVDHKTRLWRVTPSEIMECL